MYYALTNGLVLSPKILFSLGCALALPNMGQDNMTMIRALLILICCLIGIYSSYAWSPIPYAAKFSTKISRKLQQYKIPSQLFDTKNKEQAIPSSSTSSSAVSAASSSSSSASTLPYNWKEQWYAVTYASYLPK